MCTCMNEKKKNGKKWLKNKFVDYATQNSMEGLVQYVT